MPFGKDHYKPIQQSTPPELSTANGNEMVLVAQLVFGSQE